MSNINKTFEMLMSIDGGAVGTRRCYNTPPFRYAGSKMAALDFLLPLLPTRFKRYVEDCGGTGSVLLNKPRHKVEIFNDKCGMIANFFMQLHDRPDVLREALELLPVSRELWVDFHKRVSESRFDDKTRYAIAWYYNMCNSFAGKGEAFGRNKMSANRSHTVHLAQFRRYAMRLRGVLIENKDLFQLFKEFDSDDTIHYVDPPYLDSVNSSTDGYNCKMSRVDHIQMLNAIMDMKSMVIVSSYDSPLYNSYDWDKVVTYTMKARQLNQNTDSVRTKQIEKAYIKYERGH